MEQTYFAAKSAGDLASHLTQKFDTWRGKIKEIGIEEKCTQSFDLYYGNHFKTASKSEGSSIYSGGKQGEFKLLSINNFRNLIQHVLVLCTSQKPAFDTRAVNADPESLTQAKLGNAILEYYMDEKRLGRYIKRAAEHSLVLGKGFLYCTWDQGLGKPYSREIVFSDDKQPMLDEDGQPISRIVNEGDIDLRAVLRQDVFTDPNLEDFSKAQWVLIREKKNRFDLAARYPKLADEILSLPPIVGLERGYLNLSDSEQEQESPDVWVYAFYHMRSDALPNGRYTLFCDEKTVFYDDAIPYSRLPVFRIVPGEVVGTNEGYSPAFDLLAIQQAQNALISAAFTNNAAFGVQSILVPDQANLTKQQLSAGLAILKYNPQYGEPKALQLTQSPPELYQLISMLDKYGELISGINSVARGNPDNNLKSGTALGLVQSMAVQFASGFQESWVELLEDVGTFILTLLKDFAQTERMVAIAGKSQRGNMQKFKGQDLAKIDRAVVKLGNAMARTVAGRFDMAKMLLDSGLIKTPQELITVLETGQLEPAVQAIETELSLIHQENDDMLSNKPVRALVFDNHLLHMQEHKVLFANPEVRNNSDMLESAMNHWMEHKGLYETQDPIISMVSGEPPAPQPMQPPMPSAQGGTLDGQPPEANVPGIVPPGPMPVEPGPMDGIPMPPTAQLPPQ